MYQCKTCQRKFEKHTSYAGHIGHCGKENDEKYKKKQKNGIKKASLANLKRLEIKRSESNIKNEIFLKEKRICELCKKEFTLKNSGLGLSSSGRFCSKKCASKIGSNFNKKEVNKKISESLKGKKFKKERKEIGENYKIFIKICPECNKLKVYKTNSSKYCSNECRSKGSFKGLSAAGKKSAKNRVKRSKNEIAFYELCLLNFLNVLHNTPIFNGWDADIILQNEKIAILWNGPWHYRKITQKHSVKQVQNRDRIKTKEIIKAGYIPYIIKDNGKYNLKFVQEQFDIFKNSLSLKK